MKNVIQNYPWGSRKMLAELQGRPASPEPEAELWMGSHPRGLSLLLEADGRELPLQPDSLPYLFKILTAEKGLSIQAHPSLEQAREGYERENAAGIPIDASHRNYRDRNHKPELICGVTDFWGLRGFRRHAEIVTELRGVVGEIPGAELRERLSDGVEALAASASAEALRALMLALLSFGEDPDHRETLVAAALAWARRQRFARPDGGDPDGTDRDDRYWWVLELARQFPGDPGVLAPLYLNLIHLAPGEAVFLEARTLHAYLYGAGVEIMASSDNVLRSGCTTKHVDVAELGRVLDFEAPLSALISPDDGMPVWTYRTPAGEFELQRIRPGNGSTFLRLEKGQAILLALGASVLVGDLTVAPGASVFLDGEGDELPVTILAGGSLFVAAEPGGVTVTVAV